MWLLSYLIDFALRRLIEDDITGVSGCTPAAGGGADGFRGTAASCSVPVQHAPPTLEGECVHWSDPQERDTVVVQADGCLDFRKALLGCFRVF